MAHRRTKGTGSIYEQNGHWMGAISLPSVNAKGLNRDRQVAGALETYAHLFDEGPVVVAGDLNDSAIWDKPNGARPFAAKVQLLPWRSSLLTLWPYLTLANAWMRRFPCDQRPRDSPAGAAMSLRA